MRHWRGMQQPRETDRKKKGFRKKLGGFVSDVRRIQVRMERGGQAVASGDGRYMEGSRESDALDLACPTCFTSETMSVPRWSLLPRAHGYHDLGEGCARFSRGILDRQIYR